VRLRTIRPGRRGSDGARERGCTATRFITTGSPASRPASTRPSRALGGRKRAATSPTSVTRRHVDAREGAPTPRLRARTFSGSDVLALEATLNTGDFAAGYGFRDDLGMNPGVWVDVARRPADFATQTYATREDRSVSTAWLAWSGLADERRLRPAGAAEARVRDRERHQRPSTRWTPPATTPSTRRGILAIATATSCDGHYGPSRRRHVRWDPTRFDFDGVEGVVARRGAHRVRSTPAPRGAAGALPRVRRLRRSGTAATRPTRSTPTGPSNVWLSRWDAPPCRRWSASVSSRTVVVGAARDGGSVYAGGSALSVDARRRRRIDPRECACGRRASPSATLVCLRRRPLAVRLGGARGASTTRSSTCM
jgi:hypothetical protein